MSGAGSTLITIPTWLILGHTLPVALAASQVNGALWTPIAARNYLRGNSIDWELVSGLVIFGLIGAYIGANVVLSIDSRLLQKIVGLIIIFLVILTFTKKEFGALAGEPSCSKLITSIFALPLGFYEAFFASGNGIFTSVMLIKTRGLELSKALGYYYVVSFFWCAFSAYLYLINGNANLELIIPSSIGAIAGAYFGSLFGSKGGSRFVKMLFVTVGGILGVKLLLGF
jgi:uncharacterized protein